MHAQRGCKAQEAVPEQQCLDAKRVCASPNFCYIHAGVVGAALNADSDVIMLDAPALLLSEDRSMCWASSRYLGPYTDALQALYWPQAACLAVVVAQVCC